MKHHASLGSIVAVSLALAFVGLCGPAAAQGVAPSSAAGGVAAAIPPGAAITADAGLQAVPGSAVYHIAGSALRPRTSVQTFGISASGGCIYATADSYGVFNSPVWLPQGSVVTGLRMHYYDTDATTAAATGWFTVYNANGAIVTEPFVLSAGSAGYGYADTAPFSLTIDYSQYSYVFNWRPNVLGTTMQLCGFTLTYTPPRGATAVVPLVQ